MSNFNAFLNTMEFCYETYGSVPIINEDTQQIEGFICPNCGDPIYFEDWTYEETDNWLSCPICGEYFDLD